MSNDKTKTFRPHVKNRASWFGTNNSDIYGDFDALAFYDDIKGRSDDFDFDEVMSPDYTPRPRAGVRHPGKATLKERLFESDERAALRENGRAW